MAELSYPGLGLKLVSRASIHTAIVSSVPISIPSGDSITVDARGFRTITVIREDAAVVQVSRVDTIDAGAHETAMGRAVVTSTAEFTSWAVDWPFYRFSASSGGCVIALS